MLYSISKYEGRAALLRKGFTHPAACCTPGTSCRAHESKHPTLHEQVNSIIREGRRQRFCQQCGRFHDLTSFDGDKRSCRARLQRHNARRRKKPGEGADAAAPGCGACLLLGCIRVPCRLASVRG